MFFFKIKGKYPDLQRLQFSSFVNLRGFVQRIGRSFFIFMTLFSQRQGITPLQKAIQRESIDDDLRNRLWTALNINVWDYLDKVNSIDSLVVAFWTDYLKKPIDILPHRTGYTITHTKTEIRRYFFGAAWWEILDFLEFVIKSLQIDGLKKNLREMINSYFTEENSAYRFIENEIVEISDETEISAIEGALENKFNSSREHIRRALELISDKKEPDYRNSIKESISAVESICQTITGKEKATLGDCLKMIDDASPMHSAFKEALNKLYGYTSDEGGIRHSLNDSTTPPSFADAKFMLVSASAFINYVLAKASENKISLNVESKSA